MDTDAPGGTIGSLDAAGQLAVLEALPDLTAVIDGAGTVRWINKAGLDLCGVHEGQFDPFTIWDVLDPAGNRLHRIQGQQKVTGGDGTGWTAVSAADMRAVADTTASQLTAWLSARAG